MVQQYNDGDLIRDARSNVIGLRSPSGEERLLNRYVETTQAEFTAAQSAGKLDPNVSYTVNNGASTDIYIYDSAIGLHRNTNSRIRAATYIPFGDSRIADAAVDTLASGVLVAPNDVSRSWVNHLQARLGGRLRQIRNAGISGNNTTQMLARIYPDVIAYNPGWVFFEAPINDIAQDVGLSTIIENVKRIRNIVEASGARFATDLLAPWTGATALTAAQKENRRQYNQWAKAWARENNIPLADQVATNQDITTGLQLANTAYDAAGHYSDWGGFLASQAWINALDSVIPKANFLESGAVDTDNLVYDGQGNWTIGAALPATWTSASSTAGTLSGAVIARTDGVQGKLMTLQGTASAQAQHLLLNRATPERLSVAYTNATYTVGYRINDSNGQQWRATNAGTSTGATFPSNAVLGSTYNDGAVTWERVRNFAPGDIVYAEVEVFVLAVSGGNLGAAPQLLIQQNGGQNCKVLGTNDQATKISPYPVSSTVPLILRSRNFTIDAGVTQHTPYIYMYLENGVTATLGVGRVVISHVTNP